MRLKPTADAKIAAIRERLGVSYNQAVNMIVEGFDEAAIEVIRAQGEETGFRKGVETARPPARAAGFTEAANVYRITVPCARCGQPMEFRHDDPSASLAIRVLTERGLVRSSCPSRLKYTAL